MHRQRIARVSQSEGAASWPRRVAPRVLRSNAAATAGSAHGVAPSIVDTVVRSPGRPLDAAARADMESRFGHDFSHVRVHTDAAAVESAAAVAARAYTVGPHVVFGDGRYAPGTGPGDRLLAHELAHVLQQGPASSAATGVGGRLEVTPADGAVEREADRAADAAMSEQPIAGAVIAARHAGGEGLLLREATPKEGREFGPFDESYLIGRAEAAVKNARPDWVENGLALLAILRSPSVDDRVLNMPQYRFRKGKVQQVEKFLYRVSPDLMRNFRQASKDASFVTVVGNVLLALTDGYNFAQREKATGGVAADVASEWIAQQVEKPSSVYHALLGSPRR